MSVSRHSEAQIIGALKQLEAGRKAEDVAREIGVSKPTIYAWKAKYGGMDASQAQEAKQLRREHAVAQAGGGPEPGQGHVAGGDRKNRMGLVDQRSDARWLLSHYAASERRVSVLVGMAASSYRYESKRTDEPLRTKLVELAGRSRALGIDGCMCCCGEVESM